MAPELQIDEEVTPDGELVRVSLVDAGKHFELRRGDRLIGLLSAKVIMEVVQRYGRPLENTPQGVSEGLDLHGASSLRSWRYRAPVDLEDKLYLLLYRKSEEPIAVLSRQVSSALRFLCGER